MNKLGKVKGRSAQTCVNKKRVLTKRYNKSEKLKKKITLQEWLKQIKQANKSK